MKITITEENTEKQLSFLKRQERKTLILVPFGLLSPPSQSRSELTRTSLRTAPQARGQEADRRRSRRAAAPWSLSYARPHRGRRRRSALRIPASRLCLLMLRPSFFFYFSYYYFPYFFFFTIRKIASSLYRLLH